MTNLEYLMENHKDFIERAVVEYLRNPNAKCPVSSCDFCPMRYTVGSGYCGPDVSEAKIKRQLRKER